MAEPHIDANITNESFEAFKIRNIALLSMII